jgi:hypothetical protein
MSKPNTPAERVAAYIQLRDYKKSAQDEFNKSLSRVNEAMEKLEAQLLSDLTTTGMSSLAAAGIGTVYRRTEVSATVDNREAFLSEVREKDLWEALDVKANKTFVREFMDRTGQALPGVKVTMMDTIGVRRSS